MAVKSDLSFGQALAFPCLRRGVVHLIDTDLSSAVRIPESESVESGARMTICRILFSTALDKASSAIRLRAAVNRRPMLAKGCPFAIEARPFRLHAESSWQMVMED